MTENDQSRGLGIILMFIGGLLTIIGGVLLGTVQVFSSRLIVPSDAVNILEMQLFLGILFDLLGICFYSSSFYSKDEKADKPYIMSKGD
jgi:hypothetical protein